MSNPSGLRRLNDSEFARSVRGPALALSVALTFLSATSAKFDRVVIAPGPAVSVVKLTEIQSKTFKSKGDYFLTTVLIQYAEGMSLDEILFAGISPNRVVLPREAVFPPGLTSDEADRLQVALMSESQHEAVIAALQELGMNVEVVGAEVREVTKDSDASKKLKVGDVITSVGKRPVKGVEDVGAGISGRKAGESVAVDFLRDGQASSTSIVTFAEADSGRVLIGVTIQPSLRLPIDIKISSRDIGGPSAGLIFALNIFDMLVEEDLTRGLRIAGTGEIVGATGQVGPVGGYTQKVLGARAVKADIFLVPRAGFKEAQAAAGKEMRVIAVGTLGEAIRKLREIPLKK